LIKNLTITTAAEFKRHVKALKIGKTVGGSVYIGRIHEFGGAENRSSNLDRSDAPAWNALPGRSSVPCHGKRLLAGYTHAELISNPAMMRRILEYGQAKRALALN